MTDIPTTTWTPEFEAVIGGKGARHPSPWQADGEMLSEGYSATVRDASGWIIVDHTDDATAALIAAAPELLAALIALVDSFEKHRPKELWDAARAAISHATPKENERGN